MASLVCMSSNATEVAAGLSEDFLEYLGTLVATEGEWVDALDMNEGASPDEDAEKKDEPENEDVASSSSVLSTADDKAEE